MQIVVFGSGAWGTALSLLLHGNGHHVTLWTRRAEKAALLRSRRKNPSLAGVQLPQELEFTADPAAAEQAELVVFVTPSYALRQTAELATPYIRPGTMIVSATKGLEPETNLRMSQIISQTVGKNCPVAVLSGPSHAEEVSRRMATGCVAACQDMETAELVQGVFMSEMFRVYTSQDVAGVELCGATKNIVALGCGIIDGLALGDNARALFMTRALSEISGLCKKSGADPVTCYGLAGMGDLIVTCTSTHSRNYRAGLFIGKGAPAEQALQEIGAVVEGYYAAGSIRELAAKLGAEMPICQCIYDILYEAADPEASLRALMTRVGKSEIIF
ncbi:MAG: NAD(P)-dependent glycerol-3-phosphate dehydrogenase [Oscillospiraceae bacterium]|nr:NAD(P)-dependent glycerol-3-phosphate dehydrogenase [Oscillospiraceae bacterium]